MTLAEILNNGDFWFWFIFVDGMLVGFSLGWLFKRRINWGDE